MIKLILQSFRKQGTRSILIFIQFLVGFIALSVAISLIEGTYSQTEEMKKLAPTDTVHVGITEGMHFTTATKEEEEVYQLLQDNPLVANVATYLVEQIEFFELRIDQEPIDIHNADFENINTNVAFVDASFIEMFPFSVTKGRSLSVEDVSDDVQSEIPILVGHDLAKDFPIGSILNSGIADDRIMTVIPKQFIVVGVLPRNMIFWKGNSTSLDKRSLLRDDSLIVAPMQVEQNYGFGFKARINYNNLITLHDPKKTVEFQALLTEQIFELGQVSDVKTIAEEIERIKIADEIVLLFTLTFSSLILILSSFGLLGVILASIVRRQREFGIRYALGSTRSSLAFLVVGEMLLLLLLSSWFALLITKLFSITLLKNLLLAPGIITFTSVFVISLLLSLVASLIPLKRMLALQPVELIGR